MREIIPPENLRKEMVKLTAQQLGIDEKIVNAVIVFQSQDAAREARTANIIYFSKFGRFSLSAKKVITRVKWLNRLIFNIENALNKEKEKQEIVQEKIDDLTDKLIYACSERDILKEKFIKYFSNRVDKVQHILDGWFYDPKAKKELNEG